MGEASGGVDWRWKSGRGSRERVVGGWMEDLVLSGPAVLS